MARGGPGEHAAISRYTTRQGGAGGDAAGALTVPHQHETSRQAGQTQTCHGCKQPHPQETKTVSCAVSLILVCLSVTNHFMV